MQMTFQELNPEMFPKQNAIVSDFHARLSALQETDEVSKILEGLYSLKSCGLLKSDSLNIYSLKTLKGCSTMKGGYVRDDYRNNGRTGVLRGMASA